MHGPIQRWSWFVLGWVMVGLGIIGLMLPVMPTTIFMILAAGCFSHSSPRFERWLLEHRWFGGPIRRWRERGAIPRGIKMVAISSMAAGFAILLATVRPALWLDFALGAVLLACAIYVVSRPDT